MDSAKNSLSKAAHLNGVLNGLAPDEALDPQRDGDVRETPGEVSPAPEPRLHHRGSAESHRKSYSYQRRTKQKVVTDFATVSKGTSAATKPRIPLRQVLFNQSEKNPAPELCGQLDLLRHNLEAFTVPVRARWTWAEDNRATSLESNWTDVVRSHSQMTKMQRNQQDALWEFVSTELIYINKLLVIRELVLESLLHLHQQGFLLWVTAELLFSNLPSIISAHQLFWQEVLFPMLQEVRRTGAPFDPRMLEAGCLQFRRRFSSYKHYCWEEESTQEFARREQESSPQFHAYVQWIETHPQAERMRLGDMQAKPHQRITKYPLLLGAVLKNTSHPGLQQALRAMLSSVIRFLESINDYMRFKDEELALSISAERVEGYEVEGINEEIDRHVREVSAFDLTCPVSGVGPEVIRTLLLEENLKIRGRKDSKMEVVALLFSDVLLITKAQKKGERLKVIRPPLALDKTHCMALKDGCSFVLVEVGELLSVMNVYIFVTGTAHSCSTWVSTVQQAKETLRETRGNERSRQMDKWRLLQEFKSQSEVNEDEGETEARPVTPSEDDAFEEKLDEKITEHEPVAHSLPDGANEPQSHIVNGPQLAQGVNGPQSPHGVNGPQSPHPLNGPQSPRVNGPHSPRVNGPQSPHPLNGPQSPRVNGPQSPDGVTGLQSVFNGGRPFRQGPRPLPGLNRKSMRKSLPAPGYELIEMKVRNPGLRTSSEPHMQESSYGAETREMKDKKVQSAPDLEQHFVSNSAQTHYTQPHSLMLGGYPDPDYPINQHSTLQKTPEVRNTVVWRMSRRSPSDSLIVVQETLCDSQSVSDCTDPTESRPRALLKELQSPGLRRRRPQSVQSPSHTAKSSLERAAHSWSVSNNSSSDSDSSVTAKRNSLPSDKSSFRVLTLNSLRPNQGFWMMDDTQTVSEPELPDQTVHNKRPKMRTQRSASIPNIMLQERSRPRSSVSPLPPPFPLQGLLNRATERHKDTQKQEPYFKTPFQRPWVAPSPSLSATPSPSPSDADRESEWEEEVELFRHRVQSVSQGWREQLVDDEDDGRSSTMFSDGVNVDWAGWCFDDEEVLDHLQPGGEAQLEGVSRSLAFCDLKEQFEHEDGECSQV